MLSSKFNRTASKFVKTCKYFSESQKQFKVVLMPGHGVGPEITQATLDVLAGFNLPIEWEYHKIHDRAQNESGDLISDLTIQAIQNNKYGLKGPFMTPIGKGYRSLNVTLRKKLKLYANVRPCKTFPGLPGIK